MTRFLSRLIARAQGSSGGPSARRRPPRSRPGLEALEDRLSPAVVARPVYLQPQPLPPTTVVAAAAVTVPVAGLSGPIHLPSDPC
jgi:hypothetical protein